jgi:DNA-binding transcriptional MerR regulator
VKNNQTKKTFKLDSISKELHIKKSTIREWENKFSLKDTFLEGKGRFYTQKDLQLIKEIKNLILHEKVPYDSIVSRLTTTESLLTKTESPTKTISENLTAAERSKSETPNVEVHESKAIEETIECQQETPSDKESCLTDKILIPAEALSKICKKASEIKDKLSKNPLPKETNINENSNRTEL